MMPLRKFQESNASFKIVLKALLFSKKQGYATTLCDLRKHKIFDGVKGRSPKELATYLETLLGKASHPWENALSMA
ncbi:MAG: hypothetical protein K0S08_1564 [Gammaproteobacteria bacterium]|jgi:predicted metal-dependent peptidase|nr:hypothetical protein [Gammaproteobacteria bacterium]